MRGAKDTRACACGCGEMVTKLLSQAKGEHWYVNNQHQARHMPPPGSVSKDFNPYRGQKETRPCSCGCGEAVTRYLTPKRVDNPWFASYACRGRWQQRVRIENGTFVRGVKPRRGDTIPCEWCGVEFYRQPAYIKQNRRYHSQDCWNSAQRVNQIAKACAYCGEIMHLAISESARQYHSKACEGLARTKRPTGRTHNGRPVIQNWAGYLTIYEPTNPACNKQNGRMLEHRWVVEQFLGRYLSTREQVDHINQDKTDNRIENLQLLSPEAHTIKTNSDRKRKEREALAEIVRLKQELERQQAVFEKTFGENP